MDSNKTLRIILRLLIAWQLIHLPIFAETNQKVRYLTTHKSSDLFDTDEVAEAFSHLRSFKELPKFPGLTEAERKSFRLNFMPGIKNLQIEDDQEINTRVRSAVKKVLKSHDLENQCEAIVLKSSLPTVLTWKLTFITFTTAALNILTNEEITALTAHEVGHLYYVEELRKARETNNAQLARVIELKSDIIALETLDHLQVSHRYLSSAVAKLVAARDKLNVKSIAEMSPSLADRSRLITEYERRLAAGTLFSLL